MLQVIYIIYIDLNMPSKFNLNPSNIGNFRNKILESNMVASVRVNSRTDNVAGVKLPVFSQYATGAENTETLGLAGGARKIGVCREKFAEYLKALIKLASLQTSFVTLDEALKITNRRVNALENVTVPRIVATLSYIGRYDVVGIVICGCICNNLIVHCFAYVDLPVT